MENNSDSSTFSVPDFQASAHFWRLRLKDMVPTFALHATNGSDFAPHATNQKGHHRDVPPACRWGEALLQQVPVLLFHALILHHLHGALPRSQPLRGERPRMDLASWSPGPAEDVPVHKNTCPTGWNVSSALREEK